MSMPIAGGKLKIDSVLHCAIVMVLGVTVACSQQGGSAGAPPSPAEPATSISSEADESPTGVVTGYTATGGEILEIVTSDGVRIYPATLAHLTGSVYDSTKGIRLGGVRVSIEGTDFAAVTDDGGGFFLAVPLEGSYDVSFSHPWFDSVGYRSHNEVANLSRGTTDTLIFATPSLPTTLRQMCGEGGGSVVRSTIVGVVEGTDEEAVSGATVTAVWQEVVPADSIQLGDTPAFSSREFRRSVTTDESGFFAVCGLPPGHPVSVQAKHEEAVSRLANVVFPWALDGRLLLAWGRVPGEPYDRSYSAPNPIWKLDLQLGSGARARTNAENGNVLSGVVADRMSGQGLSSVSVVLNGADSTTTREDGTFDIVGWEPLSGEISVVFKRLGYHPWEHELLLDSLQSSLVLSVMMRPLAVAVEPVIVEAERLTGYLARSGFYRRERKGLGHHVSPEWIEERRGEVSHTYDYLSGIPGVNVLTLDNPIGDAGEVYGRVLVLGSGTRQCLPRVYVDGRPTYFGASLNELSMYVGPEDVAAIEVYRRWSEAPVEYGGGGGCVVLIWTRSGRRPPPQ
jgi:hypothetical protein